MYRYLLLFWALCWLLGCGPKNAPQDEHSTPQPAEEVEDYDLDLMLSVIREQRRVLLVYGEKLSASEQEAFIAMAQGVAAAMPRLQVAYKSSAEVSLEELKTFPIYLLGTPASNSLYAKLIDSAVVQTYPQPAFKLKGKTYSQADDVFFIGGYPNPLAPALPVSVLSGNSNAQILQLSNALFSKNWRRLLWAPWGYQVYRNGNRIIMGHLLKTADGQMAVNPNAHYDFEENTAPLAETDLFKMIRHGQIEEELRLEWLAQAEASAKKILQQLGKAAPDKITVHLYGSTEDKTLLTNRSERAHFDHETNTAHVVLHRAFKGHEAEASTEGLLRALLGEPKKAALERGFSIYYTPQWQKQGALYWTKRLAAANDFVPLKELLDNTLFAEESPLTFGAYAGTFVHFLVETWGIDGFVQRYRNWSPNEAEIAALSPKWEAFLKNNLPAHQATRRAKPQVYFKGFNFAHEGYHVYNGYGSRLAEQSLNRLSDISCNAVAIVPYSFMRDPKKPAFFEFTRFPGSENDESVAMSAYHARSRGMITLLKPQLWLGGGHWPGDVEMQSPEDWERFFGYYRRWIRHYALLAEIHEMDMLCLGVEFAKATLQQPAQWRKLGHDMRHIFAGPTVYAANWGEEIENAKIWEAFDYIGVNCYYPLSDKQTPSDQELKQGFEAALQKIKPVMEAYKKPVIFTEIGFRSIGEPWRMPHAEPSDASVSFENQARCYGAVCEVLSDKAWCQGVFWWKWPSYMDYTKRRDQEYAPLSRPAERVVKQWFLQQ